MTKAVIADGDQLECGPRWITSRRATLKLFDDRLECGDWTVPYEEIRDAILSSFRSPILRIPGFVLAVRTDAQTYHFGLNGGRFWNGQLPFAVERRKSKLRLSPISLLARIAVIGGIFYLLWQTFG
jgi:hypothetical protein